MVQLEHDYINQYRPKILTVLKIQFNTLKRGHIIEFLYQKEREPHLVLVLTPRWLHKLHGIKLNSFPYTHFDTILRRIRTTDKKLIREAISDLKIPAKRSIQQPKVFYRTYFKPSSTFQKYTPYRTYTIEDIKDIRLVDFDYGDFYKVDEAPIKGSTLKGYRGAPER